MHSFSIFIYVHQISGKTKILYELRRSKLTRRQFTHLVLGQHCLNDLFYLNNLTCSVGIIWGAKTRIYSTRVWSWIWISSVEDLFSSISKDYQIFNPLLKSHFLPIYSKAMMPDLDLSKFARTAPNGSRVIPDSVEVNSINTIV